jgi:hypothetical protein
VTCAAAIIGVYPYGGSRHDAFLGVFVAGAVGVAISYAASGRLATLVPAAVLVVPLWLLAEQPHYLDEVPQVSKLEQMQAALEHLHAMEPAPQTVVTDQHGSAIVNYYLCRGVIGPQRGLTARISAYRCNDREIIAVQDWNVPERDLETALREARMLSPGTYPGAAILLSVIDDAATRAAIEQSRGSAGAESRDGLFGKIHIRPI